MRHAILLPTLFLLAAACDDSPTDGSGGRPGISFVTAPPVPDTVDAILPLVVEVRGPDGEPQAGVQIRFAPSTYTSLYVAPDTAGFRTELAQTTGVDGRARVRVKHGQRAGDSELTVSVDGFPAATARYTVLPGAPATLVLTPRDSMLYVGNQYSVTGSARDRHGNARADGVAFSAGTAHVSVANGAVRGESVGRGFLLARTGTVQDTVWVSVVPRGVLAGRPKSGPHAGSLVIFNTDGSTYRALTSGAENGAPGLVGVFPAWNRDGTELFYLSDTRIMATDGAGTVRVVWDGHGTIDTKQPVQVSADNWVYFTRGSDGGQKTFWRVRADGTNAAQVSPAASWGVEGWPSPSPTGDEIIYRTNRITNSTIEFTLRVMNPATGVVRALDVPGTTPRWSPTGEWIAYRQDDHRNVLRLMRPNGTGVRPVGANLGAHEAFSWSPDGIWLAITGNQPRRNEPYNVGVFLVNVTTGEQIPLPMKYEVLQPAWKP